MAGVAKVLRRWFSSARLSVLSVSLHRARNIHSTASSDLAGGAKEEKTATIGAVEQVLQRFGMPGSHCPRFCCGIVSYLRVVILALN
jgi:hypothetical protein